MNNNQNMRRIIIATVISFIFFIAYDYFVLEPKQKAAAEAAAMEQNKTMQTLSSNTAKKTKINKSILNSKILVTIRAKDFEAKIDEFGRISSFILKQKKFEEKGKDINLVSDKLPKPLEIRFDNPKLNSEAFKVPYSADKTDIVLNGSKKTVILTQNLPGEVVKKIITIYPNGRYDIKVNLSKNAKYFITPGYRPSVAVDRLTVHGSLVKKADDTLDVIKDGDAEQKTVKKAIIAAGFDRYYTTLLFSKKPFEVMISPDNEQNPVLYIVSDSNLNLTGYIGPKYVDTLKSINPSLVDVVQYGVGTFFARNLFLLLDFLHKIVINWGVAIILLVVIVRLILFPLTYKGMVSMYKLKELAPKMKEIQLKYKKDPQKLQMHMMKLYKEHGANPLGGCLPLVLQIPIFYGIYKLLLYSIELKGDSFLWIHDLSVMDHYFILPVLMGVSMYFHQRLTPSNFQDKMQEKIFKFLPVIFTFMMATFPAGLVLYWTTNNILSIAQQWFINRVMAAKKAKK